MLGMAVAFQHGGVCVQRHQQRGQLEIRAPDAEDEGQKDQREGNREADEDHEKHGDQHDQANGWLVQTGPRAHQV